MENRWDCDKGFLQLAIRSGYYKKLNVMSIKEGELVHYDPMEEEIEVNLIDDEDKREKATTVGYYAFFEYMNGFKKAMYWSKDKMLQHADKYSNAFSASKYKEFTSGKIPKEDAWKYSSFWYKDFDGMAYKTMLRQLISKWGIMSAEMQTAYTNDQGVAEVKDGKFSGTVDYVDNRPEYKDVIEQAPVVEEAEDNPLA